MSVTKPAFQNLPFHIVLAIVDHVLAAIQAENSVSASPVSSTLLYICQSTRVAYLRRSCDTLVLYLDSPILPRLYHPKCPSSITPLTHQTGHWVRHVSIQAKSWYCVANTSVIGWMRESVNLYFASAHTLSVEIGHCAYKHTLGASEISRSIEYIHEFLQLAKQMVPSSGGMQVTLGKVLSAHTNPEHNIALSRAIAELLRGSSSVDLDIDTRSQVPIMLNPDDLERLVRIKYMVRGDCHQWLPELVRRNSGTLTSLTIVGIPNHAARSLIHYDDMTVTYPLLETLALPNVQPPHTAADTAYADVGHCRCQTVHFPVLRRLRVTDSYPFDCSILLHSSNSTLEYLHIPVSADATWPDIQFPSFEGTQLLKLKTLVLQSVRSAAGGQSYQDMGDIIARYIYSLMRFSSISRLEYNGLLSSSQLDKTISESAVHTIRTLSIGHTTLSLSQIVRLLRDAPRLATLLCGLGCRDPVVGNFEPLDAYDYICANLCPLNTSLAAVDITANFGIPAKLVSQLCAFLAIGCPRLTAFAFWPVRRSELRAMIGEIAMEEPYRAYSEKLVHFSSKLLA